MSRAASQFRTAADCTQEITPNGGMVVFYCELYAWGDIVYVDYFTVLFAARHSSISSF